MSMTDCDDSVSSQYTGSWYWLSLSVLSLWMSEISDKLCSLTYGNKAFVDEVTNTWKRNVWDEDLYSPSWALGACSWFL